MLVCHCHALTDRDIRRAVRTTGACSVAEVGDHCGAATGCGGCYEVVDEIVTCEKRRLVMVNHAEAHDCGRSAHEPASLQLDLALTG
jgi:bacterioferritin-associated ferredoxin